MGKVVGILFSTIFKLVSNPNRIDNVSLVSKFECRGLSSESRSATLTRNLQRHEVDVFCLQETRVLTRTFYLIFLPFIQHILMD